MWEEPCPRSPSKLVTNPDEDVGLLIYCPQSSTSPTMYTVFPSLPTQPNSFPLLSHSYLSAAEALTFYHPGILGTQTHNSLSLGDTLVAELQGG